MSATLQKVAPLSGGEGHRTPIDSGVSFVLEMRSITKAFPGVLALDGMSLKVRPGTVHVLVGENGAKASRRS